ncbi:MAG TPA: class I SAM-dependent methyltransferase [Gaiellaceae bacterium]
MGEITFHALRLGTVPGRVMTPRPASERLVDAAVDHLGCREARVADVGTGSGAIAIAVAASLPGVRVWATDIDPAAVALARANVRRHELESRVVVRQGDLLHPIPGDFDLIAANLPYLAATAADAHPELAVEPRSAVFVDGDGLDPYRRLVAAARTRLRPDGLLVIQLHRQVLAASRDELDRLAASVADAA